MAENKAARSRSKSREQPVQMGRRERHKQEKLERIIAAAKQLFGSKGFTETTTQEIAEKADIGTGTLFLYAKSKEDLLIMIFRDEMIEVSRGAFRKLPPGLSVVDQLMHIFGTMTAYHNRDTALARALLKEITILTNPERLADLQILMRVLHDGIGNLVAANQKTGKLRRNVNPQMAAEVLFAIYYTNLVGWLGGQTTKRQFVRRLRLRLAIAIEGLTDSRGETANNPQTATRESVPTPPSTNSAQG